MSTIFACPVCASRLIRESGRYRCENGHHYDRARQGQVNLLPHGRRRESGDSAEMLQARRRIFDSGLYAPVAEGIVALAAGRPRVLDAGCGEGYYLRSLDAAIGAECYGIDIGKTAAAMASRAHPAGAYAVANAYRIPVLDSSADLVLKVFAPAAGSELARVLAPGGIVIEVIPGPAHMRELRRLIYRTDREHDDAFSAAEPGVLEVRDSTAVRGQLPVGGEQLLDLVRMTPYWHHADESVRETLRTTELLTVTLECDLRVLSPG
ncbi:MAG TPA: methyltransferase domain-containing protein [Mycobacteriales bacterium]|nr:methyltransferase domain-containing protein [Mycobacteriales bacterium]